MRRRGWLALGAALGVLLLCAAGARLLLRTRADTARVTVAGGDAGGLPRGQPADEHFDAAALERALQETAAMPLAALVIMRDNYLVFERYGRGYGADSMLDGGHFADALVAMAAGVAAQQGVLGQGVLHGFDPQALRSAIESGTQQHYETYLSRKIWAPINAAPAWIELPAGNTGTPADCCLHARVLDWMRIASLLVDDGRFEGKQILPRGWIQRMARPLSLDSVHGFGIELGAAAQGAEPFAAAGVLFLRGPARWRMWVVPSLKLAVLFGAAPSGSAPGATPVAAADETRLPNLVIRALSDRPAQSGDVTDLQRLVPGH